MKELKNWVNEKNEKGRESFDLFWGAMCLFCFIFPPTDKGYEFGMEKCVCIYTFDV
jgi:hypothetical protein